MSNPAKALAVFVAVQHVLVSSALAWPAVTTANVNLRKGPAPGFSVMRTVREGTELQVEQCDTSGSWCAVSVGERKGFMSGAYLKATDLPEEWPREFVTDDGATIVLHRPQITDWEDFSTVTALVATEYREPSDNRKNDDDKAEFGVIEFTADSHVDNDAGEVLITDIKATNLNFSTLSRQAVEDVAVKVGEVIPVEPLTMSLERMTASLESYQQLADVKGLKADPPPIFFSSRPAILLQTDDEAVTAPVASVDGLSFVVNTNWDLLQVDESKTWYLRNDTSWLMSDALIGPWEPVDTLPELVTQLPAEDWADARDAIPAQPFEDEVPQIVYSDEPAELVVTDGVPRLEAVPGTGLQWVNNSENDVFFHKREGNWYFLISGRWFRAPSLDGPWTFATPDLPRDFRNIPADSPYYAVRASIPGTSENDQARLLASIPEIARVEPGSVNAEVEYAGDPQFEPIEGTDLYYAVNSEDTVIRVGDRYYVVRDGIWFVGDTTEGPFEVARAVPDEIYTIPPSSPVYNVTYVRIYNTEPDAVWFGYTAGYLHAYLSWGTIVYGSGWHHRPHWHNWRKHGRYPVYFRRHLTFGSGIYYNPLRRAFGRYGFYYGPHRGLGFGKRYHWRKHRHVRLRPAYRRDNGRNFLSAYDPSRNLAVSRTRPQAANLAGNDVYGGWNSKGIKRSKNWARDRRMNGNTNLKWRKANNSSNNQVVNRSEIFAGQDGKVYRRKNGTWQRREGSKWSRANESSGDAATQFRKREDAPKKTLRKKANTKRETITRKKKPHLRRSLDASRASNKKAIQKRQRSPRKVDKSNKKRLKRQLREEKQP